MTTYKENSASARDNASTEHRLTLAEILEIFTAGDELPLKFTAYDGSSAGPDDAELGLDLLTPRGTTYLATAPGELGLARAYVSGDLDMFGVHPGDPYQLLRALSEKLDFKRPPARVLANIVRCDRHRTPQADRPAAAGGSAAVASYRGRPPAQQDSRCRGHPSPLRRVEHVLRVGARPVDDLHVRGVPDADASLEDAQENKYRLVFEKLRLKPGDRLLDVGCGWGGMVRYAARQGVKTIGVTLSKEQAAWAQRAIEDQGLSELAEVRHCDYRDVRESGFDAVSSIGLTEHIGVANYPAYFRFLKSKMRTGALLLNHCITRPENRGTSAAGGFIDRYVFPDGELTGSGRIITEAQDVGLEVVHEENLRHHYALTLRDWCRNLVEHWDEAVEEVGLPTAKVWGLYMAGSTGGLRNERRSAAPGAGRQTRPQGWRRRAAVAAVVDGLTLDLAGAELALK